MNGFLLIKMAKFSFYYSFTASPLCWNHSGDEKQYLGPAPILVLAALMGNKHDI